jgi:protein SCO1/2
VKNRAWIWIITGFLVVFLVAAYALPNLRPYRFHGTLIQSQDVAPDFTLTTQQAQTASLSDFRGKLVVLYFGYTSCPDVCPATLVEINNALEELGEKAEMVQVIMVTVDPERDTPQKLAEYLAHFNPDFIGLTGSPEQIAVAAALYGIYLGKNEGSDAIDYLVDHTATLMVIDEEGYLKLIVPFGTTAKEIADDLAYILK